MTERPDLFTAVISNVGVSNTLRAEFSQNGPTNIDEFGTVTERDGFLGLKAMDAFHAVKDGTPFPAEAVQAQIDSWLDRMEAELDTLGYYQDALDALGAGVAVFGADNRLRYANRSMREFYRVLVGDQPHRRPAGPATRAG